MEQTTEPKKKKKSSLTTGQVIAIIITFLCVVGLWYWNYDYLHGKPDAGTTGDMFGAVNALFSGLAFAGIIFTILLQRNELQLQREEIEETREEFIKQNKTLKQQRFENTFFNMLNLQNQIVQAMHVGHSQGKEVINDVANRDLTNFLNNITQYKGLKENEVTPGILEKLHGIIEGGYHGGYYKQFEIHFNHYFRHLYHVYKFIYFSDLQKEEKNFYASLVRAQLSQNELLVIALNGIIVDYGYPRFLYLMKEYEVLKNFRWDFIREIPQRLMIKSEMQEVAYPFEREKPAVRNVE